MPPPSSQPPQNVNPEELYNVICAAASQDPAQIKASADRLKQLLEMMGTFDTLSEIAATNCWIAPGGWPWASVDVCAPWSTNELDTTRGKWVLVDENLKMQGYGSLVCIPLYSDIQMQYSTPWFRTCTTDAHAALTFL